MNLIKLLPLLLLMSCEGRINKDYLVSNYVCDELEYDKTYYAFPCYNLLTGKRVDTIYNPTNVIEIAEDEELWK